MPVSSEKLAKMYDRISLRVTPGYKEKFKALAESNGLGTTAYFEWLVDELEKKSTRAKKKDISPG